MCGATVVVAAFLKFSLSKVCICCEDDGGVYFRIILRPEAYLDRVIAAKLFRECC